MFSAELFPATQSAHEMSAILSDLWADFCTQFSFSAAMLLEADFQNERLKVVAAVKVPIEPFNGAESDRLAALVQDCFTKYPKAHIHSIKRQEFAGVVERFSRRLSDLTHVTFVPVLAYGRHYVFLGFQSEAEKSREVPENLLRALDKILCQVSLSSHCAEVDDRVRVMETFVKEIGHDVAVCVQAIVAKLRTIRDRRVDTAEAINRKVLEIEREVTSAYSIAEMLGLAVDPNYQMRSFVDFDVLGVVELAIEQLQAEADERRIQFDVRGGKSRIQLWGDEGAIKQCVIQVLMNAIKYSFGGTIIHVTISESEGYVSIHVANKGHRLPTGIEAKQLWDFGFRGEKARELHVNGSGIGLFTVRKITLAHHGHAWARGSGEKTTFGLEIPNKELLRSRLGFLV